MSRTPEGIEKDKVKRYLDSIGAYQFWPVPGGYGKQGVDCYTCLPRWLRTPRDMYGFPEVGIFCAIEVKAPNGKITARQIATLNEVDTAKGITVAGTGDEIIEFLKSHAR